MLHYGRRYGLYWAYPARKVLQPRRFHAFSVGVPRSGTHSIGGLFANYRAVHEPEAETVIELMVRQATGQDRLSDGQLVQSFQRRDKYLWLEMEASNPIGYFTGTLVKAFPEARFILTIRDCYSWLDSYLNQQSGQPIYTGVNDFWDDMRRVYYSVGDDQHAAGEQVLAERGLYTLDGYLTFWQRRNQMVLEQVPADRLLVIRTTELGESLGKIGRFLSVPADSLVGGKAHLGKGKRKFGLLPMLDRDFLEAKVAKYGGELMREFFPDIRSMDDAL